LIRNFLSAKDGLKRNLKFGNKGRISKKVVQYLQGFFLAGNLRAADCYLPENMHATLKELVKKKNSLWKKYQQ
jgi:hypothetical protein